MPAPSAPPPAPTAPTAAPKAAPAPSPNAKPAAAANPAPTITPQTEAGDPLDDAFGELSTMAGEKPAPKKEAKKDVQNPTVAKAAEKDDDSSTNTEEDGIVTPASKDDKTETDKTKPVKAAELRTAYEGLKKKVKEEYEPKLQKLTQLEREVAELKTTTPQLDKAQQERVAAIEKRNEFLEAKIRIADFKNSKPYEEVASKNQAAWNAAETRLKGISITRTNNETGESQNRPLAISDIQKYAGLEPEKLWSELRSEIPDPAERTMVINHIQNIRETSDAVFKAEAEAEAQAETHAKTQTEQQQQFQQNRAKLWRQSNESLAAKYPNWFNKVDGDNEGNTLFDRGTALADLAMFPQDLTPEKISMLPKVFQEAISSQKPFTQEQLVKLHSIVRNKAANHDRLAHQNKTLTARVAELEKSLKEYEESGPDGARAGLPGGQPTEMTADQELQAIAERGGR